MPILSRSIALTLICFVFGIGALSAQIPARPDTTPVGIPAGTLPEQSLDGLDGSPGRGVARPPVDPTVASQRDRQRAQQRAAVEAAAQGYYTTASRTITSIQSYLAATSAATQPTSGYLAYADQYTADCTIAPWECASYVYEAVTEVYLDNSALSDAPLNENTFAAAVGTLQNTVFPALIDPVPSADAYQALVLFAIEHIGAVIDPLYAGTYTADVARVLTYLPDEVESLIAGVSGSADRVYWGLWQGGSGSVLFADCTDPQACMVGGETTFTATSVANEAGAYTLLTSEPAPTDANSALALVTRVYPALGGRGFTQITDISTGYAFSTLAQEALFDGEAALTVTYSAITAGTVDLNGRALVYVVVVGSSLTP